MVYIQKFHCFAEAFSSFWSVGTTEQAYLWFRLQIDTIPKAAKNYAKNKAAFGQVKCTFLANFSCKKVFASEFLSQKQEINFCAFLLRFF